MLRLAIRLGLVGQTPASSLKKLNKTAYLCPNPQPYVASVHYGCGFYHIYTIFFNFFPQVLGHRGIFLISFSEQSVYIKIVGFFAVALRQMQRSFLVCRDIDIF